MTNAPRPNPTTVLMFSKFTLSAIRLALATRQGTKEQRLADHAVYVNACAAAKAARLFLLESIS